MHKETSSAVDKLNYTCSKGRLKEMFTEGSGKTLESKHEKMGKE